MTNNMKSYLKFLSRNKLYTAIEAVGLAVSLAFVIVIFCYAWQQLAVTRQARDYKRLYALTTGQEWFYAFPGEMAVVKDQIPDVDAAGVEEVVIAPEVQEEVLHGDYFSF